MQYSNGNGTEERIVAMDENIKLLEAEQAAIANASSQQELITAIRSVREVWTNAQKTSLTGAGQIVSQKIGEFLDKSENLSGKLDTEIQSLNMTGVDTSDLQTRLASYNLYIKAAQEKKKQLQTLFMKMKMLPGKIWKSQTIICASPSIMSTKQTRYLK